MCFKPSLANTDRCSNAGNLSFTELVLCKTNKCEAFAAHTMRFPLYVYTTITGGTYRAWGCSPTGGQEIWTSPPRPSACQETSVPKDRSLDSRSVIKRTCAAEGCPAVRSCCAVALELRGVLRQFSFSIGLFLCSFVLQQLLAKTWEEIRTALGNNCTLGKH